MKKKEKEIEKRNEIKKKKKKYGKIYVRGEWWRVGWITKTKGVEGIEVAVVYIGKFNCKAGLSSWYSPLIGPAAFSCTRAVFATADSRDSSVRSFCMNYFHVMRVSKELALEAVFPLAPRFPRISGISRSLRHDR